MNGAVLSVATGIKQETAVDYDLSQLEASTEYV